jgi:hypothetical protein
MNMRSGALRELGDVEAARTQSHEALELAKDSGFPPAAISARLDLLYADLVDGDLAAAEGTIVDLSETIEGAKGFHQFLWSIRATTARAEAALLAERWDDVIVFAETTLAEAERFGRRKYASRVRVALGRALLATGRGGDAVAALREAASEAEALGHLPSLWPAQAALSDALAGSGDGAGAAEARAAAVESARRFAAGLGDHYRATLTARPDVASLIG